MYGFGNRIEMADRRLRRDEMVIGDFIAGKDCDTTRSVEQDSG